MIFFYRAAKVWFSREEMGENMEIIPGRLLFPSLFGVCGVGKKGSIFLQLCFCFARTTWAELRALSSKTHPENITGTGGIVSTSAALQQWGGRK